MTRGAAPIRKLELHPESLPAKLKEKISDKLWILYDLAEV